VSVNPGNRTNYINEAWLLDAMGHRTSIPVAPFAKPAETASVFNAPGTSGRDILRGPGLSNLALSLFKNFAVTETIKTQLRLQAYNVTNTAHFANPDSNLSRGAAQFGRINSTVPFSYRQVELGLRVTF
jgi:hypothetical protein